MNAMTANLAAQRKPKMTTYLIDKENSITALGSQQADFEGEIFASQQELAELAAQWPPNRLVEVWNGIPGLTPVKKFTDRKSAVGRIWKAIQSLDGGAADGAEPAKEVATASAPAPKAARNAKKTKHAAKQAKKAKAASTRKSAAKAPAKADKGKPDRAASKPAAGRDGSKKAEIIALLQREGGATLSQIMKATGWQAHSVRGFISGALGKKMRLTVGSVRREDGERVYTLVS
jgi:hypothetical protein